MSDQTKGTVLFIDDDQSLLDTFAIYLEEAGYDVLKASNETGAEEILDQSLVDLLIIDVHLRDSRDRSDKSGIEFAKREKWRVIPKIILTIDGNLADTREVMRSSRSQSPIAVNYLEKSQDIEEILEAIDEAFALHVPQKEILKIIWKGISPNHLAVDLCDLNGSSQLNDRVKELENVFKQVFQGFEQIVIQPLAGFESHRLLLIHAFHQFAGPKLFIAHCPGSKRDIDKLLKTYNMRFPDKRDALTGVSVRFNVFAYPLSSFGVDSSVRTFEDILKIYTTEKVVETLAWILQEKLSALHGRTVRKVVSTRDYMPAITYADVCTIYEGIFERAKQFRLTTASLRDTQFSMDGLLDKSIWASLNEELMVESTHGLIHGNLISDAIILNAADDGCLVDYSKSEADCPILLDYIQLACDFRKKWSSLLKTDEWIDFERAMADDGDIEGNIDDWEIKEWIYKQVHVLSTISGIAIEETMCDPIFYQKGIIWNLLGELNRFDPAETYTISEIQRFLHLAISVHHISLSLFPKKASFTYDETEGVMYLTSGKSIRFTSSEADLFSHLFAHRNQTVSRIEIAKEVYGAEQADLTDKEFDQIEYQRINTAINRLRATLDRVEELPKEMISTIRGRGYKLIWGDD